MAKTSPFSLRLPPEVCDLLMRWSHRGLTHWGIIFISEETIPQRAVGALVRALEALLDDCKAEDALLNQAVYPGRG